MYAGSNQSALSDSLAGFESKLQQVKQTIEELLDSFDMQDEASWPQMLDRYAMLATDLSQIQDLLQSPRTVPALLLRYQTVPHMLSHNFDPSLSTTTDPRIHNMDCYAAFSGLRATVRASTADEEKEVLRDSNGKTDEQTKKQIALLNKNVDLLATHLECFTKSLAAERPKPAYDTTDTIILAKFVSGGRVAVPEPDRTIRFS